MNWVPIKRCLSVALGVVTLASVCLVPISSGAASPMDVRSATSASAQCPIGIPNPEASLKATCVVHLVFTGGMQHLTVPEGVVSVVVGVIGASGGGAKPVRVGVTSGDVGGGQVAGTLAVTPGEVLTILVGGVGGSSNGLVGGPAGVGGFGGGGSGGGAFAGGGGGASIISGPGGKLQVVAGGAGGSDNYTGGSGGFVSGFTSPAPPPALAGMAGNPVGLGGGVGSGGGGGGTQSSGGEGGLAWTLASTLTASTAGTAGAGPATSTAAGRGGVGGIGTSRDVNTSSTGGGGGGGGGYYGGGAGSGPFGGGGGGSSYAATDLTNVGIDPVQETATTIATGNGEVDFAYTPGCSSASSSSIAHSNTESALTSSSSCPLIVKVTGLLTLTSGLTHKPYYNPDLARFYGEVSRTSSNACQSGCTDLTVKVTDPANKNKAVAGATVDASVQPIRGGLAPYASGVDPGTGFLCRGAAVVNAANCGNGSHEVTDITNGDGEVKLRYWAPGVITTESVLLTVKVNDTCNQSQCPSQKRHGEATPNPTLTIMPNVLVGTVAAYKTAQLTPEESSDLAQWTTKKGTALKDYAKGQGIEKLLTTAITTMFEAETEGPIAIASYVKEANSIDAEEQGFMAMVLNAFKVRERGLGVTSTDAIHKVGPTPGRDFLLNFAANNGPFGFDGGLTWLYGSELAKLPHIETQTMYLRIFEVSFCQQGKECGPGYSGVLNHRYDGIQPYLYFQFTSDRGPAKGEFQRHPVYSDAFIVPYNAEAWMESQFGK